MSPSAVGLDYAAQLGVIMLHSTEEIIGQSGVEMVFAGKGNRNSVFSLEQQHFSFEMLGALQTALEQIYGIQAGQGIALRIGQCSFYHILRAYGSELRLNDLAFRLMPLSHKIEHGMTILADFLGNQTGWSIGINKMDKHFVWEIKHCFLCHGRQSKSPICYLMVGLLQESLYWASGGKIFSVKEIKCIACSDSSCVFEIDRIPLG